ncbi:hypothetical protein ES702_05603 [subsurface metagenome]
MKKNDKKLLSPKTSVLIHTRPRAHTTGLRRFNAVNGKIVITLIKLRNRGLAKGTLRNISFNLKHLTKHCDLEKAARDAHFVIEAVSRAVG